LFISHEQSERGMRILFVLPCCIGDAVLATAALAALRAAHPQAEISWAIGSWSRPAIQYHPAINAILDTGAEALPIKSWAGFWEFVKQVRAGQFDLAVSLLRSPLMSLALLLAGVPKRAGLDSNGRGFGYNIRVPIKPLEAKHEAEIYLSVIKALGIQTDGYEANLPILDSARSEVEEILSQKAVRDYIILNPTGGSNPGMQMDSKRWPVASFAEVGDWLSMETGAKLVLLGGPEDDALVTSLRETLRTQSISFIGKLSFPQIGALAAGSMLYLGNDTGLTHLAAASGAKTAMILGPSDPKRYAPYTKGSIALWKETSIKAGGVAAADTSNWDWERDGISPTDALHQLRQFLYAK
jgi:ADP-heptose:LPS heptosyltransferase